MEPVSFGSYHRQGQGYEEDDFSEWVLRIKNGLWPERGNAGDLLAEPLEDKVVVVPVPSSEVGKVNGMTKITRYVAEKYDLIDGTEFLTRHTSVEPQHKSKAARSKETHLESIAAAVPEQHRGSRILLLDDIYTSGSTMSACLDLLLDCGAKDVTCAVFGRSI